METSLHFTVVTGIDSLQEGKRTGRLLADQIAERCSLDEVIFDGVLNEGFEDQGLGYVGKANKKSRTSKS